MSNRLYVGSRTETLFGWELLERSLELRWVVDERVTQPVVSWLVYGIPLPEVYFVETPATGQTPVWLSQQNVISTVLGVLRNETLKTNNPALYNAAWVASVRLVQLDVGEDTEHISELLEIFRKS